MTDLLALPRRFASTLRADGLVEAMKRSVRYPLTRLNEARKAVWLARVLRSKPAALVFAEIYRNNYWGNEESVSGYGSTLANTAALRRGLISLFREFGIRSVYDAPCGDFNWMREVVKATDVTYCGVDIVPELIESNRRRHEGRNRTFGVSDITRDPFPDADIWICRDCLFHLSYADIGRALRNFVESNIPCVLTTTYVNTGQFANRDIRTGDFRMIDLFAAPLHFPRDVGQRIDDTAVADTPREVCLWTREQIAAILPRFELEHRAMTRP